ncbi:trehalose utilization protein ThuA [Microbacterium enclense]|uniref:Trehalose utilization protein ThuA n=1 Tax=Microbacterium enclense TaxID=993073 RepID=A0A3S3LSL8_9MICO|nr:ThuA domain-containing protein [Microbacterium enclense]RWR15996.1 trehalose utilization protein ThuA [Microbacterium enclense]
MTSTPTRSETVRVVVWGENRHEQVNPVVREIYPDGMHSTIAEGISRLLGDEVTVSTRVLDDPEHGMTEETLAETDVLLWWGHTAHEEVSDEVVERIQRHVLEGMGIIVLHSGHHSKIFRRLMGTTCSLRWRNDNDRELVWTVDPRHPIAEGVPQPLIIPGQEMYGEFFDIPEPDELVFISSFSGGEVFRSGITYRRGHGRVFYFSPGDEIYPVYHHPDVQRVIANGVRWARPRHARESYLVTPMYLTGDFDRPVLTSPDGLIDYYTRELIAPRESGA